MRFLTAGESHGKGLTVVIDGFPAGVTVSSDALNNDLFRRQQGYGRGGRMKIEKDQAEILSGIRFGKSTGAPVTLFIENRDFKNWTEIMAAEGQAGSAANEKSFNRPRPGHADLAGYYKYDHHDLRDVLERASARETAARVAAGALAKQLLAAVGIDIIGHVTKLGGMEVPESDFPDTVAEIKTRSEANELRTAGGDAVQKEMKERIDAALQEGTTLGGEVEIIATSVPPGLGTYTQWDRRLDGLLAQAVMSVQAVKSVAIGSGDLGGEVTGSDFHDEIVSGSKANTLYRPTNRAGGLEGGTTNGMPVIVRAVMKPISTMRKALTSVNLSTGKEEQAHFERSDVTAVPACAVVCEAMVAFVLADALLAKFGEDTLSDIQKNIAAYQERLKPIPVETK